MNIYLESVNLDEIRNAASAGLADGVAFSRTASSSDVTSRRSRASSPFRSAFLSER